MKTAFTSRRHGLRSRRLPGLNRQVFLFLCHSLLFHIGPCSASLTSLLNFYLVSIGYDGGTIAVLQSLPRLSGFLIGLPIRLGRKPHRQSAD